VEAPTTSFAEALARLSLFADVPHPRLEALAHAFSEEVFAEGQRVFHQDVTGAGFCVIQRTLALRTPLRSQRSRLPFHVRRPCARSKDAAVISSGWTVQFVADSTNSPWHGYLPGLLGLVERTNFCWARSQ
jgi:hypothetical protein